MLKYAIHSAVLGCPTSQSPHDCIHNSGSPMVGVRTRYCAAHSPGPSAVEQSKPDLREATKLPVLQVPEGVENGRPLQRAFRKPVKSVNASTSPETRNAQISSQFSNASEQRVCDGISKIVRDSSNDPSSSSTSESVRPRLFPISKSPNSVRSYRKFDDKDKTVSKAVIDFLGKKSEEEAFLSLTRTAEIFGYQPASWDQMMKQLELRGARDKALQVFRFLLEQRKLDLTERNYITIIGILGRDGKLALCQDIFEKMKNTTGIVPTVLTYSAMITGYQKQGLVKEASDMFEQMRAEGCLPNVIIYNTLMHACSKEPGKVAKLFSELQEQGLQPDYITYNCMINSCISDNDLQKASKVLQSMRERNYHPNLVTYTSLVNAFGKSGQLDTAVQLFEEMKENGCSPNSWTYNSLLKAYGNEGLYKEASILYKEMESVGCLPTLYTYNTVIDCYGRGELFVEAENVLLDMQKMGLSPDRVTYNTLMYTYCKAGHLEKGQDVFKRMESNGCMPDLWTYNILLDATAKYGTVDETMHLYILLRKAGCRPNVVTYGTMMTLCGRLGLYDAALNYFHEMSRAGCLPNATIYSGLINSYSHHGLYKEARSAFEDMVRAGIRPDVRSYTVLMDAFGRAGLCDEAESLLKEMKENGFVPDSVTYSVLARCFASVERWHDGLKYYRLLQQQSNPIPQLQPKLISEIEKEYVKFILSVR